METMDRDKLLLEIRDRLRIAHGDRLRGVVLFGSVARGDATADSDVDVLVLLTGPVRLMRDLSRNVDALYELSQQIGRRISAKPVAIDDYESLDCPLFRRAHEEGIAA